MTVERKAYLAIPKDTKGGLIDVAEGCSCIIKFDVKDPETDQNVQQEDIDEATMTLFDEDTGIGTPIDPGAPLLPIEDENVVSKINDGVFRYNLPAEYNKIIDTTKNEEVHYAAIKIVVDAGAGEKHTYNFLYKITVDNNPHK